MRTVLKIVIVGVLLTSLFGLSRASLTAAEAETKLSYSSRGGILVATAVHRFEVFFYPTGVRVFPLDAAANAVDASRLTASATVSYPGAPPEQAVTTAPSRADPYRCRAIVIGREHRPCGCAREGHDGRLRDQGSSRFDNVHRSVHDPAGIRRQGSRHQHQHLLRVTTGCKPWLRRQSSGRRLWTEDFAPACGSHACVRRNSHDPW